MSSSDAAGVQLHSTAAMALQMTMDVSWRCLQLALCLAGDTVLERLPFSICFAVLQVSGDLLADIALFPHPKSQQITRFAVLTEVRSCMGLTTQG